MSYIDVQNHAPLSGFCLWKEFCICLDSCENQQIFENKLHCGVGRGNVASSLVQLNTLLVGVMGVNTERVLTSVQIEHGAQVMFKDNRSKLEQVSLMFTIMP